jgi:uncharacterized membrane protein YfcA
MALGVFIAFLIQAAIWVFYGAAIVGGIKMWREKRRKAREQPPASPAAAPSPPRTPPAAPE